jgi:anoctamin-10
MEDLFSHEFYTILHFLGEYAPFREDMMSQFASTDDGFVSCENNDRKLVSLFRSSERQKIIDFIIGSRIRDSGAELGPSTRLGKQIQRRVPLHSHVRLEALYTSWVLFWDPSNWTESDGKSLQVERTKTNPNDKTPYHQNKCPNILYRLVVGCFSQPLDDIEKYYGEKVAFYFAWLEHVSFHLLSLSVAGLILFIFQVSSGRWDHELRPFFSILVMMWSFVVMVTWRRRSNFLAYHWGTLNYQEEEVTRPDFRGTKDVVCPVTNTYIPYYPPWKRWLMMCFSTILTFGFTMLTLLGILILYGNRDVMLEKYFASGESGSFQFSLSVNVIGGTAPILAVVLNKDHLHDPKFWLIMIGFPTALALILPLLNFCLRRLSLWLNEIENHRTEAEHQTHFIIKVFAFRFVCYFAALYYYSFIGVSVSGTDNYATEHGILRVASNLFTYLTIANWWSIFLQVFFPLSLYRWRVFRERLHLRNELRSLEMIEVELAPSNENIKTADERLELKKHLLNRRLLLEHAQCNIWEEMMLPEHDSFVDYLFAATQFAYVTCFSVVLPITPLIVLINHLLNMRLDAFKICRGRRRPLSQKTGGIGVWSHVLHVVTVLAILTNCSLMALVSLPFLVE